MSNSYKEFPLFNNCDQHNFQESKLTAIWPESNTRMRSYDNTVLNRSKHGIKQCFLSLWYMRLSGIDSRAMQINVLSLNSVCMVCWIIESVSKSTDALRGKRYEIFFFFKKNCLMISKRLKEKNNLRSFVQDNNPGISHKCAGKAEKRLFSYTQVRSSSFYDSFKGKSPPSRGQ